MNAPIIGIDLGMTTATAAYVAQEGEPAVIIPTERGRPGLPAYVAFVDESSPLVGVEAKKLMPSAPEVCVGGVKRLLGRKMDSQAIRDFSPRVGYQIVADEQGRAAVEIEGRHFSPAEITSHILRSLADYATEAIGTPVEQCVIAVPAYFNSAQRAEMKDAAERAGLSLAKLVHEPTAAALAYGYNRGGDARVLILDMGGFRFDLSVMEITANVFDVVATGGDAYLGGDELDRLIADWIIHGIKKGFKVDLSSEPQLVAKVRSASEYAKRELSRFRAVDLQIPLSLEDENEIGRLRLHRNVLDNLAEEMVGRVLSLTDQVLKRKGLKVSDIDDVLLVSGATRLGLLKDRIAKKFGRPPKDSLAPENVIAFGAALLADSLTRERSPDIDVVEDPIGIALADGRFMRIIDKDSRVPITRRVMIPTTRDEQRTIEVDLFQGESENLLDTSYLGTIVYRGVPKAKAGDAKVIVDLALDAERLLTVSSPEKGRTDEHFALFTKGHKERPDLDEDLTPMFEVATRVPKQPD